MPYDNNSIQVLSDIDHIRLRRGMYIGEGTDPHALISEIIDNAIDEVQGGFSDHFEVFVDTKTNTYKVRDFGRGIPHGTKKLDNGEEKEILEVLVTKANSGGKFNSESYMISSGLNGLGITVTSALSEWLQIVSYRDNNSVSVRTEKGKNIVLSKNSFVNEPNGTLVKFCPDSTMFQNKEIPISYILDRCRVASALGYKGVVYVDGVKQDTTATMHELAPKESGIATYVTIPVIEVKSASQEKLKVAISYTSDTKDKYYGYTNLLTNSLGGTHVQCLSKAIQESWQEFLTKNKTIKLSVELHKQDFLVGIRAVCAVFITDPEFSSQTKEKLVVNKHYFDELMELFKKEFIKYLSKNKLVAQQLLKRFEEYRISQNALLSRKEISSLIKVNEDSSDNIRRRSVVSKLVECTSTKREGSELFIVEGNSALGPYLYVRDKKTQAVLPLRGKILNVTGKSLKEALKNKEICDIANSIGCGIGANCDAAKSRYERIIISADADPDGLQINCLILAVFINLFPDMVRQGRVFISIPPLYCWKNKKSYDWTNDVAKIPKGISEVIRFKGLGEMDSDQLFHFLVNPTTRNIIQVEYPSDVDKFNHILGTSEGKGDLLKNLNVIIV